MYFSEVSKRQVMERICELCEMGVRDSEDNFECLECIFPCSRVCKAFEDVIEILEG